MNAVIPSLVGPAELGSSSGLLEPLALADGPDRPPAWSAPPPSCIPMMKAMTMATTTTTAAPTTIGQGRRRDSGSGPRSGAGAGAGGGAGGPVAAADSGSTCVLPTPSYERVRAGS